MRLILIEKEVFTGHVRVNSTVFTDRHKAVTEANRIVQNSRIISSMDFPKGINTRDVEIVKIEDNV